MTRADTSCGIAVADCTSHSQHLYAQKSKVQESNMALIIVRRNFRATWVALAFLWAALLTPAVTSDVFFKVENPRFPDSINKCLLKTLTLEGKIRCAAACQKTLDCTMYCLNEGSCVLFNSRIGRNWSGYDLTFKPGLCYTKSGGNLTPLASVVASKEFSSSYKDTKAISGYFCNDLTQCYCSEGGNEGYLAISFGSERRVASVRIQTWSDFFQNVEVRVGNSSSKPFGDNALLGSYPGKKSSKELLIFEAREPLVGSVVSIYQFVDSSNYLCLCDVQVFGK